MTSIAANISVMFREVPLLQRFAAARAAGFDGVELQFPYAESTAGLARAARAAQLPTALINVPVIPGEHPFGICGRPEMRRTFRDQLPMVAEYAAALGARRVHVLAGVVSAADDLQECWQTYAENLRLAAGFLAADGIRVLIEPLNESDAPNYLLNNFDLAASLIEHCQRRVGLQFDVYHAARMGLDPAAELARRLPLVEHVQFADAPGRHEPGSGRISFTPVLDVLRSARYTGWLSAEYSPAASTCEGLGWLSRWRDTLTAVEGP